MSDIKVGDRVRFRAGRGHSDGKVANVSAGMVLINTKSGKSVTRKLAEVTRVGEAPSSSGGVPGGIPTTPAAEVELDDL